MHRRKKPTTEGHADQSKMSLLEEQYRTRYQLAPTFDIRRDIIFEILDHCFDDAVGWGWFQEEYQRLFDASPEARDLWPALRKQEERDFAVRTMLQAIGTNTDISTSQKSKQGTAPEPKGFDGLGQKKMDLSQYLDIPGLSERQRDCLSMKLEYGLPVAQIARRLGLNRRTVDEHIAAGGKRLRRDQRWQQRAKRRALHPDSQDDSDL